MTLSGVSSVDVVDETFIAVAPAVVAAAVGQRSRWRTWWPDLRLEVQDDRGPAGQRWRVSGAMTGSMEVWLEPVLDGTVLHYFLRAESADLSAGQLVGAIRRRRMGVKSMAFGLKAELEAGRPAGEAPHAGIGRSAPGR